MMNRGIRRYLAREFPNTSLDIAIMVMLRISTHIAVATVGRERAPVMLSRLINRFLLVDHYDDKNW